MSYDGISITYDAIGNPLSDGTWTYTWEKGRQLKQMSKSGTTIQFKYDHNGIRTQKVVNVNGTITTTNYIYNGKRLVHLTQGGNWVHFYYDGQGPAMVNLNGTLYTYIKNLQGDIVGILNNAGSIVVEYKYDAWGKLLSTTGTMAGTLGALNPLRYRGYVFDTEVSLYYILERYFSPEINRFINSDRLLTLEENNIYAYCKANPVTNVDYTGLSSCTVGAKYVPTKHSIWIQMDPIGREQASDLNDIRTGGQIEETKRKSFDNTINNIKHAYESFWQNYHGYQKMKSEINYSADSRNIEIIIDFVMEVKSNEIVNAAYNGIMYVKSIVDGCKDILAASAISATIGPISYSMAIGYITRAGYSFSDAQKYGEEFFDWLIDVYR